MGLHRAEIAAANGMTRAEMRQANNEKQRQEKQRREEQNQPHKSNMVSCKGCESCDNKHFLSFDANTINSTESQRSMAAIFISQCPNAYRCRLRQYINHTQ